MDQSKPQHRQLILILGGARSGKSSYAEALATQLAGDKPVTYIATATAQDDEMRARIARHQSERPPNWTTLEAPLDPATALRDHLVEQSPRVVLLDCITLLVANLLEASLQGGKRPGDAAQIEARAMAIIADLLAVYQSRVASLILVSNEVGMGVVPPYPLGRIYRDVLGHVNAHLAQVADAVLMLIAGLPVELKELSARWQAKSERFSGDTASHR
ncbi:MAG TPA: bifunctional adenosylcobinamide kinase/adenosylcobinamide-phosphate guanylyltransferase [Ktedonobacterales bacterium]|nr:bifunctional adenosylcobinamide kinase/adenosylcobinamide-phosphate guanylyltransferase [Ktedonobacterales bacterium]